MLQAEYWIGFINKTDVDEISCEFINIINLRKNFLNLIKIGQQQDIKRNIFKKKKRERYINYLSLQIIPNHKLHYKRYTNILKTSYMKKI